MLDDGLKIDEERKDKRPFRHTISLLLMMGRLIFD